MGENDDFEDLRKLIDSEMLKKHFIVKYLIVVAITFIVLIVAVIAGISAASSYNKKILAEIPEGVLHNLRGETKGELENNNGEQITEENTIETQMEEPKPRVPIYSEEGKNRMDNIYVADTEEKIAYLTFDDGPSSKITPQILQILANENIKASFFVLGSRVELLPELVKQEYDAGHYIANHGYSHDYSRVYSSAQAVLDEYNQTERAIKNALGIEEYSSYIFRFPGGSEGGKYAGLKNEAKEVLAQNNISYINWNALTNDAVGKPTAESLVNDLKSTSERKKQNCSINA